MRREEEGGGWQLAEEGMRHEEISVINEFFGKNKFLVSG